MTFDEKESPPYVTIAQEPLAKQPLEFRLHNKSSAKVIPSKYERCITLGASFHCMWKVPDASFVVQKTIALMGPPAKLF